MPRLSRITIFPIKSLDGATVPRARIVARGALEQDRRFALFDAQGDFLHGKREPRLHGLRAEFADDFQSVRLRHDAAGAWQSFSLADRQPLERYLSDYLGQEVTVRESTDGGFPDDTIASGPTLISTASLRAIGNWFGLGEADVRRRFRANLEIDAEPSFWEDCLFGPDDQPRAFRLGELDFWGTNPCQRCAVPTRDPATGAPISGFARHFANERRAALPAWAEPSRFDHFYRAAVNTRVEPASWHNWLSVGDLLALPKEYAP